MNENTDWELLAKYLSGECNPEEKKSCEVWINLSAENRKAYEQLKKHWNLTLKASVPSDLEHIWSEIKGKLDTQSGMNNVKTININKFERPASNRSLSKIILYAAAVLILVTIPSIIMKNSFFRNSMQGQLISHTVSNASIDTLILPDNSTLILDAGSTVQYPQQFGKDKRHIYLEGEGYFKVESNPEWPFEVKTAKGKVSVLGTEFNIRSFNNEEEMRVVVSDGKVSFSALDNSSDVILTRGLMSTISKDNVVHQPEKIQPGYFSCWMDGEVNFKNSKLENIIQQANHWYNLDFKFEDENLLNEKFDLHLKRDNPDGFINIVAAMTGSEYTKDDKQVFFHTIPE